jgi:transcription elongation factor Elf1
MKDRGKSGESFQATDGYAQKSASGGESGGGRLSKRLLHDLRNRVPIRELIARELGIRHRMDGAIFRFECPLCGSFHTSVKKTTNLARCFACEVNFNPIDMMMAVRKIDFRQSADFLARLLESGPGKKQTIRGAGGLSEIGEVFSESNILPEQKEIERRFQSMEKDIEGLKKRMDGLHNFLVSKYSRRNSREGIS